MPETPGRVVGVRALVATCVLTALIAGCLGLGGSYVLFGRDARDVPQLRTAVDSLGGDHDVVAGDVDTLRSEVEELTGASESGVDPEQVWGAIEDDPARAAAVVEGELSPSAADVASQVEDVDAQVSQIESDLSSLCSDLSLTDALIDEFFSCP